MNEYEQARRLVLVMLSGIHNPTSEIIRQKSTRVLGMLREEGSSESIDLEYLIKDIESRCEIWKGRATILEDNRKSHKIWLPSKKDKVLWKFWKRYKRYLMEEKCLPDQVICRIDELTDNVLELLEDPTRVDHWDRRGMVVGQVQSGKTSNYTGLICKAADAGYKLIIVLAGMHKSLRSQTQIRLDEGFLGFDTRLGRAFNKENLKIGVGNLPGEEFIIAHSLTSSDDNGDFNRRFAYQACLIPGGGDPVILVVKKQKSVLSNLINWAISVQGQEDPLRKKKIVRNIPLLVIDDEADNASVNTKIIPLDENGTPLNDFEVSAINGKIRILLDHFEQSAYVGYTATPFANIFISPKGETESHGEDLFPRDFIINLPAPPNYIGPSQIFGFSHVEDSEIEEDPGMPIIRVINDYQKLIPDNHPKDFTPQNLPESLKSAIKSFIISGAARKARGEKNSHNSMLVHVTRYTLVQQKLFQLISDELAFQRRQLEFGDPDSADSIYKEMETIWENEYLTITKSVKERINDPLITDISWISVKPHLLESTSKIIVKIINGTAKDVLDYQEYPEGMCVIAIGGDKLSRGLTLEGLTVSYYLRASRMYDTLMQMGRWFGFRPGYIDLCRLYTSQELVEWYRFISLASEELRKEFDYMSFLHATPNDYGLRVRGNPDGLLITAVNKMRSGTKMDLSYSGEIPQTVFFAKDPVILKNNFKVIENLVERLGVASQNDQKNFVWKDVPSELILQLLDEFCFHENSRTTNSKLMKEYVEKQNALEELISWTVVLINKPKAKNHHQIGKYNVGLTVRNPDSNRKDLYSIKKSQIISPPDEFIDLSEEEIQNALNNMRNDPDRIDKGAADPEIPSGPFIRGIRNPTKALLLIYPLDPPSIIKVTVPVIGLAFSFPRSETAVTVQYTVNNKYWEQEFAS
jgi:hypothetical protein